MKKNRNSISKLLLFLSLFTVNAISADSFKFLDRDIIFGSSIENFLSSYPEFKLDNQNINSTTKTTIYTIPKNGCEISLSVEFDSTGLSKFILNSNCPTGQDQEIINGILTQFKYIPPKKNNEEDYGDVVEEYKKGNLSASAFSGGFFILTITQSN